MTGGYAVVANELGIELKKFRRRYVSGRPARNHAPRPDGRCNTCQRANELPPRWPCMVAVMDGAEFVARPPDEPAE